MSLVVVIQLTLQGIFNRDVAAPSIIKGLVAAPSIIEGLVAAPSITE